MDFNETELIGMHLDSAKTLLQVCNARYRVTRQGKQSYVVTMDYRPNRINLKTDEFDIVTEVSFG